MWTDRDGVEAAFLYLNDCNSVTIGLHEMSPLPLRFAREGVGDCRECLVKSHGTKEYRCWYVYCKSFRGLDVKTNCLSSRWFAFGVTCENHEIPSFVWKGYVLYNIFINRDNDVTLWTDAVRAQYHMSILP